MRLQTFSFGALALSALAAVSPALFAQAPQAAQPVPVTAGQFAQIPRFNVGDSVDLLTSGQWAACTVSSPLNAGSYGLHCRSLSSGTTNGSATEMRAHLKTSGWASAPNPDSGATEEADGRVPQGNTLGARYGTREPRTCDHSKPATTAEAAKDLFICDSEHEFGGSLYLVSDVNLDVASPRPFNPATDKVKQGIDPSAPVIDIHASYNNYQCRPIPSNGDNPIVRSCDEFAMNKAAGGCFKNTSGQWHCMMYDFHPGSTGDRDERPSAHPRLLATNRICDTLDLDGTSTAPAWKCPSRSA